MQVKNVVMFQIATNKNYKVGDKLIFGKEQNGQAKRILNFSSIDKKGRLATQGFEKLNKDNSFDKEFLLKLCLALEESDFVLRELAVEHVRKIEFPNLPSRMTCMFLVDDKNLCLKNFDEFLKKDPTKKYQMIAVKLNGNIFYAKDVPINNRGLSLADHLLEAKKYWSQNQNSKQNTKEILFEGKAEVVEIVKQNY